jgi:hypothetical protein
MGNLTLITPSQLNRCVRSSLYVNGFVSYIGRTHENIVSGESSQVPDLFCQYVVI